MIFTVKDLEGERERDASYLGTTFGIRIPNDDKRHLRSSHHWDQRA